MAYKNISVSLDVYEQLRSRKAGGESFSQELRRLLARPSLEEVTGILSGKEAVELEAHVKELRAKTKVRQWY
ncbi:antitoxin VapB family protein [Candidatus Micrarchaeota archaeon]|nr:antitoxin VapB family protein [Candidatus Micrarchaeota archaeon]MBI5176606.1 antitoxin VapB family protein [Candidatus Micrarchaeota archaeon]